VWEKVGVDAVVLPRSEEGFNFAVFAGNDSSGRVEGPPIMGNDSASVAKLPFEDVIYRHGYRKKIVDGGSENKGVAQHCRSVTQSKRSTLRNLILSRMD
jgi:hypothetical protein